MPVGSVPDSVINWVILGEFPSLCVNFSVPSSGGWSWPVGFPR